MEHNIYFGNNFPYQYKNKISKTITENLARGKRKLEYTGDICVHVSHSEENVIPQLGISGYAAKNKPDIFVFIDFSREDIDHTINTQLPSTIYHELVHIVREDAGYEFSISNKEEIIAEGLTSSFEECMNPKGEIPYIQPIENELEILKKTHSRLYTYNHNEIFFGQSDLPFWFGYRIGYAIVQEYLKNHDVSFPELVRKNAEEIWKESNILQNE